MSLNPTELKRFIKKVRLAEKILGRDDKNSISTKEKYIKKIARRGIISISSIKKNQKLSIKNISIKRPLKGIDAKFIDRVIDRRAKKDIPINTPITWKLVKSK